MSTGWKRTHLHQEADCKSVCFQAGYCPGFTCRKSSDATWHGSRACFRCAEDLAPDHAAKADVAIIDARTAALRLAVAPSRCIITRVTPYTSVTVILSMVTVSTGFDFSPLPGSLVGSLPIVCRVEIEASSAILPKALYWPLRNAASPRQMKN